MDWSWASDVLGVVGSAGAGMEAASQAGSWDGLQASINADAATVDTYKWVNAIKSLYRPFITTVLVVLVYQLFCDIVAGLGGTESVLSDIFTGQELKEIMRYIVYSVVFSASTAVTWWFSERAFQPPGLKNR